jgi:hypothetical protein
MADTQKFFPSVFPEAIKRRFEKPDIFSYRNLSHFKFEVSQLSQKKDDHCGVSYKDAVKDLVQGKSQVSKEDQESIRNLVRSNLNKQGLLTDLVYENFKYSADGVNLGVDVAKAAAGEPDCVMTPTTQYINFFYELYISVSYNSNVTNESVLVNVVKLLATVEELERQHIFVKITLLLPIRGLTKEGGDMLAYLPLFSHDEGKDVEKMASVINDRLLRKFFFAIVEDRYRENLQGTYGSAVDIDGVMNIGSPFDEVAFFTEIQECVT